MASGDIQFIEDFNGWTTIEPTPFFPQIKPYFIGTDGDAGTWGNLNGIGITFNQAYILNTTTTGGALKVEPSKILNMDEEWVIKNKDGENEHNEYDKKTVNFVVEVIRYADSLDIKKATFTGITGSADELIDRGWDNKDNSSLFGLGGVGGGYPRPITAGDDDEALWTDTLLDHDAERGESQLPYTGYIPVCQIFQGELQGYSLRDNIHVGERQVKQMAALHRRFSDESPNGLYLVDCTGNRSEEELTNICEWREGHYFTEAGGTGMAGVMSAGNFDPSSPFFIKYPPMMFRSLVAGTGISISPYENAIVIDSYGGSNAIPWSGKLCGTSVGLGVYKEQIGVQDGTHDNPAIFRRITGVGSVTTTFGDSADFKNPDGDDCLIVISGAAGAGTPWSGQNCGRDGGEHNQDANWAKPQGIDSSNSRAKNVYKAYTAAQDGTADDPAIFRRLSGDHAGDSTTKKFENGGVIVDYDARENCLIGISGHIWSGDNCGTTSDGIGIYKEQEGLQDGIHQNPAIFRRLLGETLLADADGDSLIALDPFDDCTVVIPARWSGQNTTCGAGAASVFIDQHVTAPLTPEDVGSAQTPAQFRQLVGANNLPDPAPSSAGDYQINVLEEDDDCVRIRGNGVNGSLTIPANLSIATGTGASTLVQDGEIKIVWKDGLLITAGDQTQTLN